MRVVPYSIASPKRHFFRMAWHNPSADFGALACAERADATMARLVAKTYFKRKICGKPCFCPGQMAPPSCVTFWEYVSAQMNPGRWGVGANVAKAIGGQVSSMAYPIPASCNMVCKTPFSLCDVRQP